MNLWGMMNEHKCCTAVGGVEDQKKKKNWHAWRLLKYLNEHFKSRVTYIIM